MIQKSLIQGVSLTERSRCFPAGTPVLTQSGPKAIDKINIGEMVCCLDISNGKLTEGRVQGVDIDHEPEMRVLDFGAQGRIICSPSQRLYHYDAWVLTKMLTPGMEIGLLTVRNVVILPWNDKVYTLVVVPFNNYIVMTSNNSQLVCHDNSSDLCSPISS